MLLVSSVSSFGRLLTASLKTPRQTLTDAEALISDLEAVVSEVVAEKAAALAADPADAKGGKKAEDGQMVALYGLGTSPVGTAMIPQVARAFLETLYLA